MTIPYDSTGFLNSILVCNGYKLYFVFRGEQSPHVHYLAWKCFYKLVSTNYKSYKWIPTLFGKVCSGIYARGVFMGGEELKPQNNKM